MAIRTKLLCEVLTEFADGTSRARLVSATQEADDASLYVTGAYVAGTATAIVEMTYAAGVTMPFTLGVYYYAMTAERGATGGSWTLKETREHGDGWGRAEYAVVPDATKSNWPISGTFSHTYNHGNAYGQVGRPGVAFDIYFVSVSDTSNAVMRGKPAPAPAALTVGATLTVGGSLPWSSATGATAYEIEMQKSDGAGGWTAVETATGVTGTSRATNLTAGTHRVRMRSRDAAGAGAWGAWSTFVSEAPGWDVRFIRRNNLGGFGQGVGMVVKNRTGATQPGWVFHAVCSPAQSPSQGSNGMTCADADSAGNDISSVSPFVRFIHAASIASTEEKEYTFAATNASTWTSSVSAGNMRTSVGQTLAQGITNIDLSFTCQYKIRFVRVIDTDPAYHHYEVRITKLCVTAVASSPVHMLFYYGGSSIPLQNGTISLHAVDSNFGTTGTNPAVFPGFLRSSAIDLPSLARNVESAVLGRFASCPVGTLLDVTGFTQYSDSFYTPCITTAPGYGSDAFANYKSADIVVTN